MEGRRPDPAAAGSTSMFGVPSQVLYPPGLYFVYTNFLGGRGLDIIYTNFAGGLGEDFIYY